MQLPKSIVAVLLVGVVAAACGGSTPTQAPAATQGPGGGGATTDPGGGGPTTDPGGGDPTTNPGGGGLPGNGSGKITFQITGSLERSGELPFFGIGSRFGGEAGKYYAFTSESDNTQIVTVFESQGMWLVGYVSETGSVSATECQMTNLNVTDTRASGTFDCPNAVVVKADGGFANDGRMRGSFEANK